MLGLGGGVPARQLANLGSTRLGGTRGILLSSALRRPLHLLQRLDAEHSQALFQDAGGQIAKD